MNRLLPSLTRETGLSERDLLEIARTAPKRYKTFYIPKRSGGVREIAQPARELKLVQRIIIEQFLRDLPIHRAASAYRSGHSIRDNALLHAGSTPILKMDFANFFPSIRADDWMTYCRKHELFDSQDAYVASLFLFRKEKRDRQLRLAIGAPSSPMLSNVIMYDFDVVVAAEASRRGVRYSRYADDLTFSGQRIGMLKDMIQVVQKTTRQLPNPRLTVNTPKTSFVTTAVQRRVTGVVLTNDGKLSLGREKKRMLSAKVHKASLSQLNSEEMQELCGLLAYVNVVEPDFLLRLRERYGSGTIDGIQRANTITHQVSYQFIADDADAN